MINGDVLVISPMIISPICKINDTLICRIYDIRSVTKFSDEEVLSVYPPPLHIMQ